MSYHVQQNTQQRTFGLAIVVAFHVLLIWALASGLGQVVGNFIAPAPVKITNIDQKIPLPQTEPIKPVIPKTEVMVTDTLPVVDIDSGQTQIFTKIGGDVVPPTQSMSKPTLKKATKPEYPSTAARLGEEGSTGLNLYITPDGRVGDVQLLSSSGSSRLDDAAIKHAKRNWAFSACTEAGKAVGCWYKTKLVWRLEDAAH